MQHICITSGLEIGLEVEVVKDDHNHCRTKLHNMAFFYFGLNLDKSLHIFMYNETYL